MVKFVTYNNIGCIHLRITNVITTLVFLNFSDKGQTRCDEFGLAFSLPEKAGGGGIRIIGIWGWEDVTLSPCGAVIDL